MTSNILQLKEVSLLKVQAAVEITHDEIFMVSPEQMRSGLAAAQTLHEETF